MILFINPNPNPYSNFIPLSLKLAVFVFQKNRPIWYHPLLEFFRKKHFNWVCRSNFKGKKVLNLERDGLETNELGLIISAAETQTKIETKTRTNLRRLF